MNPRCLHGFKTIVSETFPLFDVGCDTIPWVCFHFGLRNIEDSLIQIIFKSIVRGYGLVLKVSGHNLREEMVHLFSVWLV